MGVETKIQWTDTTWNPTTGCTKVSPGCANCYIERTQPMRVAGRKFDRGRIPLELHEDRLTQPLRWKKPRRVFVNSMSDLFHEDVPDEFIDKAFAVMSLCPKHIFQLLTKRPKRMCRYLTDPGLYNRLEFAADELFPGKGHPLFGGMHLLPSLPFPNVWLGVSVEDQQQADERIPILVETLAEVRFLSCEPLLGPIDFYGPGSLGPEVGDPFAFSALTGTTLTDPPIPGIDWVIVGGESGPRSRSCNVEWIRDIIRQCREAGTACFVKQLGSNRNDNGNAVPSLLQRERGGWVDAKGGNPEEWGEDLHVREFPR